MWLEYFAQYLENAFPKFLKEKVWNYKDDLCVIGAADLADATGNPEWNRYITENELRKISSNSQRSDWRCQIWEGSGKGI